jgi:hypothetical protein
MKLMVVNSLSHLGVSMKKDKFQYNGGYVNVKMRENV